MMIINRISGINNAAVATPAPPVMENAPAMNYVALHPGTNNPNTNVPNPSNQNQNQYRLNPTQGTTQTTSPQAIQSVTARRSNFTPDLDRVDSIRAEQRQWIEGQQQITRQINNQLNGLALINAHNQNQDGNPQGNMNNLFNLAGMSRMPGAMGLQDYFSIFVQQPGGGFAPDLSGLSPEVRDQLIARAQEDVSENGFWGVERTSERIFNMAEALTGGDPARMDRMRQVVERAFQNVGRMFGGFDRMPEISQETHARVMERFADFAAVATPGIMGTTA